MGVIHVEGIDERLLRSIELRAAANGRSLDEEVRAILEAATDGERAEQPKNWLERLDEIRAMTKGYSPETDSTVIIREMRDRGYSNY
jgi:plasmid stability protein